MTVICEATQDQIERFRAIVSRQFGLRFEDNKLGFLAEVVERRSGKLGCSGEVYLRQLEYEALPNEDGELARELTVGETYFFRNIEQFHALVEVVLPDRAGVRGNEPLRLLSAGCSSGEEAYSLAVVTREAAAGSFPNVEILAVDLNPLVLQRAARARYSGWSLRETPPELCEKWFRREGNEMVLDDAVRSAVEFQVANLASDNDRVWRQRAYDVVFCRNVLMYFEAEQMRAALERIARLLAPGGYLFLGHAETLRSMSDAFHLCHTHNTFYYRLKAASASSEEERIVRFVPRQAPSQGPPPPNDTSWFEEIRLSSERVAALVPRPSVDENTPSRPTLPFDTTNVMDLLRKERFGEALEAVREGASSSNGNPELLLIEATLLTHSGRLQAAEETASRLLALDGQNAGGHYVLALCREHAGQSDRAIEYHRLAARMDPTFAMPRLHLGLLARRVGNRTMACQEFARALFLLEHEQAQRLVLFGGGFNREALVALCSSALAECRGRP